MTTPDIHRTVDAVWRMESAKVVAGLACIVQDVGLDEARGEFERAAALTQNARTAKCAR